MKIFIPIVGIAIMLAVIPAALTIFSSTMSSMPGATNTTNYEANYLIYISGAGQACAKNIGTNIIESASSNHSRVFQYASDHANGSKLILVDHGTYDLTYDVGIYTSGVIFKGLSQETIITSSDAMGLRIIDASNVTLENMHFTGSAFAYVSNGMNEVKGITFKDLTFNVDDQRPAAVYFNANGFPISNVLVENCQVIDSGTFGFMISANGDLANNINQNFTFLNCKAINCGRYSQFNDWVTGFDVRETGTAKNIHFINCEASGSWESGFHVETDDPVWDITYQGCRAVDNGQKPGYSYGAGFVIRGGMSALDCYAAHNAGAGYWMLSIKTPSTYVWGYPADVQDVIVRNCVDYGSTVGFSIAASNADVIISNCYAEGEVAGFSTGYFRGNGTMIDCTAKSCTYTNFQFTNTWNLVASGLVSIEPMNAIHHNMIGDSGIPIQNCSIELNEYGGTKNVTSFELYAKNTTISGEIHSEGTAYDVIKVNPVSNNVRFKDLSIDVKSDSNTVWLYAINSQGVDVSAKDVTIRFYGANSGVGIGGTDNTSTRMVNLIGGIQVINARVNLTRCLYYTYSGNATIQALQTYVTVTHYCAFTPTRNLWVTPYGDIGGRSYWVSDVTSTTFRINVNATSVGYLYFNWGYSFL
jgi:hypothetical protein